VRSSDGELGEIDGLVRAGAADATLLLDDELRVIAAVKDEGGTVARIERGEFGTDTLGEIHPDDQPLALERLGRLMANPGATDFMTLRVMKPSGHWLEVLFVATNRREVEGVAAIVLRIHILKDLGASGDTSDGGDVAAVGDRQPIADIAPCGIDVRDRTGFVAYANQWLRHRFTAAGGYADWTDFAVDPDQCTRIIADGAGGASVEDDVWLRLDGAERCFRVRAEPNRGASGAVTGLVTTLIDITAEIRGRVDLERSEQLLTATLESLAQGVLIFAGDGTISYANEAAYGHIGVPHGHLVGKPFPDELLARVSIAGDPGDAESHPPTELADGEPAEVIGQVIKYSHPDGSDRWSSLSTTVIPALDSGFESVVLIIDDITDRHERTRLLAHQAMHDSLTGLPNRSAMLEYLTGALARQERRSEEVCGVLFCDLDGFKEVNDTLGHQTGDEVLLTVAHRIHKACRVADRVGRLGGDEFIVVLEGLHHPIETGSVADRIIASVAEPIIVGDIEVTLGVSIGVAISEGRENPEEVLSRADGALYEAKRAGRGRWRADDAVGPTASSPGTSRPLMTNLTATFSSAEGPEVVHR